MRQEALHTGTWYHTGTMVWYEVDGLETGVIK